MSGRDATAAVAAGLSPEEMRRYGRHLVLPEIGREGQERLKAARVLLVGAGGLGSPAALYLAAAGVGTLGLVEFDRVDETNLQRQVLFGTADVGRPKLEAAAERLHDLNPNVVLEPHDARFDVDNAAELVAAYDLVVDGSDNFPTRYLVNDACVLAGRPDVWGAVYRFEGQASVFAAPDGPCYRCLFPEPPPPGAVPSCAEAGVLPGIVGSIQATEVIKWVTGVGAPLVGRLLVFDALGMSFREVRLRRDPDCPRCSATPRLEGLIRYEEECDVSDAREAALTPTEFRRRQEAGEELVLVDVREGYEREIAVLDDQFWIPMRELPSRWEELPADRDLVVYCRSGARSAQAVDFLRRAGRERALNLTGGVLAWSREIDPTMARY